MTAIPFDTLTAFAKRLLLAGGYSDSDAQITAQSLALSDAAGHASHGVMRIYEYIEELKNGTCASPAALTIDSETPSSLVANGHSGRGQALMHAFLERLCAKAQTQPVVSGGLHHGTHIGRVGEWAHTIAMQGFLGLISVNDNGFAIVAPSGGRQRCFSTNPVAFACPSDGPYPFVIDLSTSAIAAGKVRMARIDNTPVPQGTLQDHTGAMTTDPSALNADPPGALRPMGGALDHKGMALAMMVDCLTAALSGGDMPISSNKPTDFNNVSVTIWNPDHFAGAAHIKERTAQYLDFIRQSAPIDPESPVRIPGETSQQRIETARTQGIALSPALKDKLNALAEKLGVAGV